MNILIEYYPGGLGDTVSILSFAKDFKEQYPNDNLFINCKETNETKIYTGYFKQREEIFEHCIYLKKYCGEKIDKTIDYKFPFNNDFCFENSIFEKNISEDYIVKNLRQRLYIEFKRKLNINVIQKTFYSPWDFKSGEIEKIIYNTSKPLALINIGYHRLVSSKNWGVENYQKIIDALYDKINFVQVGESVLNGFTQKPLNHIILNLVNKTSLSNLAALLYKSDFVFTNVSGLNIFSSIPSYKRRHVFTFAGNRESENYSSSLGPHLDYHLLKSENDYSCCQCKNRKACWIGPIQDCKFPIKLNDNEIIARCLYDIKPEKIIEEVKTILKNEYFNNNSLCESKK